MSKITRVGVDLAKRVLQVHAVDAGGQRVTSRALSRDKFLPWCAQLAPGCLIAMEASSSAHHWAHHLRAMGLDARIIAAHLVAPYRLQGKTVEQQGPLCVHRLREGFKAERTACINRIRGLMAEFGLVFPQKPDAPRQALPDALEDAENEFGGIARLALQRAQAQWAELDAHLAWCDERIAAYLKTDEQAARAQQLMGVGPVGASAVVAAVGDFKQFRNGSTAGKRPLWRWPTRTPASCGR